MQALLDNQVNAINKLQKMKVGALFMEPGTGKTRTAIELVESVNDAKSYHWLTPCQNKANLLNELNKWAKYPYRHSIMGIETLSSSDAQYLHLYNNMSYTGKDMKHKHVLIVDESLKIKNWDAIRTKRILELGKLAEYKLILNGTPISKNLLDVWAQFQFLSPKILNMSQAEYKNTFCEYLKITKRMGGKKVFTKEFIVKYHNVDHLYQLIQPYVFEADLSLDVQKQYIDIDFNIDDDVQLEYDRVKAEYLNNDTLIAKNNNIFLEITQKLQHLYSLSSEKFAIVDKFLKHNNPDKVLIFRKYLDSDAELKKRYSNVKVLSLQSQSLGLNLQHYNTIIIWDKVWDYALIKQMEHRIYRTGQKDTCRFVNLNGNVGLEKLITTNLAKKCDLLEYFKNKALKQAILEL
jgi:SNF2 family DNA or RNA helicase